MFQKNNKNSINKCKVFIWAIFFSAFLIINWAWFLIVFVFFLYVLAKKENININSILKDFWVYGCLKFLFWENFNIKEILKNKFNESNKKDDLYEKIKKQDYEIEMKKLEKLLKNVKENSINQQASFGSIYTKSEKKIDKNISNKNGSSLKYKGNSFNNWKSIWDDYESVLDIMNKNK